MKCRKITKRLGAYLDGELSPRATASVEAHLRACEGCAARLAELEGVARLLSALPAPKAARGLGRRIRLAAQERQVRVTPLAPWRRAVAGMAAAAALLIGLTAGALMGRQALEAPGGVPVAPTARVTSFDPQFDPLSAAPAGSVADVVLALHTGAETGGGE